MIAYYHEKHWQDGPPHQKKRKAITADLPKPAYRPGYWVRFRDPSLCPDLGDLVGKIKYVVSENGELRYEISVGYTMHGVSEEVISCKMVSVE